MSFQFLEQDKPIYSKGQKDKRTKRLYGTFKVCEETIKDD